MGAERVKSVQQHMSSLGRAEGIEIKYGGKTGNTRLSHQLLQFAKSKSLAKQNEVAEELFRLHFSEERDIAALQTMLDAAANCGLDVDEVRGRLEQGLEAEKVDAEAAEVREAGVKGVPRFVFQRGEFEVDSAGDTMEFFELLIKIKGSPCAS
jgi:predicted DsbA family dithiol-disulfide isomerase